MKVISKLPGLIKAANLDQKTLASKTGLSPTTVGKLCRGHFDRIDNGTIEKLCLFFGLKSINQLIDIEWEENDIEGVVE
jgi:DNA-binding Xre family transcriptional regulator